jgi:UDP-glucose 4-epimerase
VRVLITGGAGFIGSHLVHACLQAGERVRVLDDLSSGSLANLAGVLDDVELVRASVADAEAVTRAARGCQVVYHQAAIASVTRSVEDPVGTAAVNAAGTLHVLAAARAAGAQRVVAASSAAVYGDDPTLPKREDMAPRPLSPYALQKLISELHCRQFSQLYGLPAVALRYFNVFGPRQDAASPYAGVTPLFVEALRRGQRPLVLGDGRQTRDFVYVADVVAANRAAATRPGVAGEVINIGGGTRTSVLELLAAVASQLGTAAADPAFGAPRPAEVRHSLADIGKARALLAWEPAVPLAQGLRETVRYYSGRAA